MTLHIDYIVFIYWCNSSNWTQPNKKQDQLSVYGQEQTPVDNSSTDADQTLKQTSFFEVDR